MRCETCKRESPVVMRVVVAREYNRALARAVYNCPACFEKKEQAKWTQDPRLKTQERTKI